MDQKRPSFSNTMRINLLPDLGSQAPGASVSGATRSLGKTSQVHAAQPYHNLLESIYDATIIADAEGNVVDFNGRAVAFLKYAAKDMSGLHVWDIIAGADEATMELILQNLAAERFTLVQAYCLCSDGNYFPAEIAVSRLHGQTDRFCLLIRNITLRREAEERLLIEHNALQNAGNGVLITDLTGSISYANPALYALLGLSDMARDESLRGTQIAHLEHTGTLMELLETVLGTRATRVTEIDLPHPSGPSVTAQVSVAPNISSEDDLVGAVFSFMDLTDRKAIERVRKEAEQQRVMLESMGAACHHLGQPATVLMTSVDLLRKRIGSEPEAAQLLDRCDEMCVRLGDTLRQMQRLTQYQTRQYTDSGTVDILALSPQPHAGEKLGD